MRGLLIGNKLALAVTAGVVFAPAAGSAFCLHEYTGAIKHAKWKISPVPYRISNTLDPTDPAQAEIIAAIDKAFETWGGVPCASLSFKNDGGFDLSQENLKDPSKKKAIYVAWFTDAQGFDADHKFAGFSFSGHDNNGGIEFASISINAFAAKWNATGGDKAQLVLDVQNELIYLIGQVLGLANSDGDSVMKPVLAYGSTARHTLKQDDVDAVVYLYPKDGSCTAPTPGTSCGGQTPGPEGDGGGVTNGDASDSAPGDGGPAAGTDGGGSRTTDGGGVVNAGDAGAGGPGLVNSGDDGGCSCRVGPTGHLGGIGHLGVVWCLAGLLGMRLARRRRSGRV